MFVMDMMDKIELLLLNNNNDEIKPDLIKLKNLLMKYVPMLPEKKKNILYMECPTCTQAVKSKWIYCPYCGQRIRKYHYENLEVNISAELEQKA